MNVIENGIIRNKYHKGFTRDPKYIKEIVLHGSGGPNIVKWMELSDIKKINEKVSALIMTRKNFVEDINISKQQIKKVESDLETWAAEQKRVMNWYGGIGFCQVTIDRLGRPVELISTDNGLYHSNAQEYDITHTIGIEIEKMNGDNSDLPTLGQIECLMWYIGNVLLKKYTGIYRIVDHDTNRMNIKFNNPLLRRKPCIGAFPKDAFKSSMLKIKSDIEVIFA